jgi:hypothetical protein
MTRTALGWMVAAIAVLALRATGEDRPMSLPDLPALRDAVRSPSEGQAPAVSFRRLWEAPDLYRGRRVTVEGRAQRRFRQEPLGSFPALSELWAADEAGNPFCLVYPAVPDEPPLGAKVRFAGTFLRPLRYQGGDGPRLAPLLAGPEAPAVVETPPVPGRFQALTRGDWIFGGIVAAIVVLVLVTRTLARPRPPRRPAWNGPEPEFLRPDPIKSEPAGGPTDGR